VRHGSESSQAGLCAQSLADTAGSKPIKIPTDKTCVLIQKQRGSPVASASLSPGIFCSSKTRSAPIVVSLLGLTFFFAVATFQFALPLEAAARKSSIRSLPPNPKAPVWDCRSAGRSSNRTAVGCGPLPALGRAQPFNSPCLSKPLHASLRNRPFGSRTRSHSVAGCRRC
jgi:hypothetical protein